jgi:salicylate hydroxylase
LTLKIAIAGGGIAGLTAALALAKNGHEITVFERAKSLEDIGAGIQLSPNAGRALAALGLADSVKTISFEPEILQLVNCKTGRILSTLPFKAIMQKRYGAPYLVVHRGDLQGVLLEAANANPHIKIETGIFIDRIHDEADHIEIAQKKYSILVVADGINSALRSQIDPDAKVVADTQTAWRTTVPISSSSQNEVSVYMTSGAHLVVYKMGQRPVINLVFVSNSKTAPTGAEFGGPARDLIAQAENWRAWPLASVQCQAWHKGRAVMIGDAAHAITPHAAQGGAMAIEDAMVLTSCIETSPTIEAAFAEYQTERQPRIARVAALSKQNRNIYQMGGLMALGRNVVMPMMPPSLLLKRLDWLYSGL